MTKDQAINIIASALNTVVATRQQHEVIAAALKWLVENLKEEEKPEIK